MTKPVFRIMPHGSSLGGLWFSLQQKRWWGWDTICSYITSFEEAESIKKKVESQYD